MSSWYLLILFTPIRLRVIINYCTDSTVVTVSHCMHINLQTLGKSCSRKFLRWTPHCFFCGRRISLLAAITPYTPTANICCIYITLEHTHTYIYIYTNIYNSAPLVALAYIYIYSIRVPGWVLKCLNLITAPGSVSNQPGSVTWLATAGISKIHAVSWKNHIEIKLQRELRICNLGLKSTLYLHISLFPYLFARKRLSNSSLTVVWQLSNSWPNKFSKQPTLLKSV